MKSLRVLLLLIPLALVGACTGGGSGSSDSDSDSGSGSGSGNTVSRTALNGSVSNFSDPAERTASLQASRRDYAAKGETYALTADGSAAFAARQMMSRSSYAAREIDSDDLTPASALVSLYLLSDVNYENPVATVKTDSSGNYTVTADDVSDYLLANSLITAGATEDEIITAFQGLGRLQVRALIVKNEGGTQRALAIQSIADPANVDETTGLPEPVSVNPIAHRITKSIVDQIRQSIESLENLGLAQETVQSLTDQVISQVADDISRIVEEAAEGQIEVPEGQSLADVIAAQEDEFEIDIPANQLNSLETLINAEEPLDEQGLANLEDGVLNADEVIEDEDSALKSSLDSESQGLLASLEAALDENVADEANDAFEQAQIDGTLDQILNVGEGQTAEEALAEAQTERNRLLVRTLQRFFLSMGLAVIVDENDLGTAGVVAVNLPSPFHIANSSLPGGHGFGDRNIRIFKVGDGDLDVDSEYTTDPGTPLGALDINGIPQAPFYYAPALSDAVTALLGGDTLEVFQANVDDAFGRVIDPQGAPTDQDFTLIDRLRIYHELSQRLQEASVASSSVIDALVENKDNTLQIKRLASVLAGSFTWVNEAVNLTPEGFPIITGRLNPLPNGGSLVDSSELVRALSLTLGTSAKETAEILTTRLSFYAQFASDAVQSTIQNENFQDGSSFDLLETLLSTYPSTPQGYELLILGDDSLTPAVPPSPFYNFARDRVARGLTSSVPSTLFGQTLTSESSINVRSALFLLDFLLKSKYVIDSEEGYFTLKTIIGSDSSENERYVPHFDNLKQLVPSDSVTIASLVSSLLNVTTIDNGDLFDIVSPLLRSGLSGLPELPEFKEQNIDDFSDDLTTRSDTISMSCTVERFDGADPAMDGNALEQLNLSVFAVQYNEQTGEFFKGDVLNLTTSSTLVTGSDGIQRRTYTIDNIPSESSGEYGLDYVVRFDIESYSNGLPELFFYVDGFVSELNLCDPEYPLFIGPDQQFVPVPGLGLVSDQVRPGAPGEVGEPEGIDISNFEQAGAPIYLTASEETSGLGAIDFFFGENSTGDGYVISAAADSNVGFAPLFGGYSNGELSLSLASSDGEPLYGLFSIMGANVRTLIESVVADDSGLSNSIAVDADNFEFDRLYLMRDQGGKFWILELRFIDQFVDPAGNEVAFIDLGIGSVNNLGNVGTPEAAFDAGPVPNNGGADGDEGVRFSSLFYGDWLILENPSAYQGPDLMPAQEVSFGGVNDDYTSLDMASDGVLIRYAGEHFEENITSASDFDTVFGSPPDFSDIPVRLDAGRDGITFVKLSFSQSDRSYVMEPGPDDATPFVTNLKHNNIVVIFDDTAEDPDSPAYLARVVRNLPADDPHANFSIDLEVIRFNPGDESSEYDVVCFNEDNRTCPTTLPSLALSSALDIDVGVVYDSDFDGVPSLFDPNDDDPNIPGNTAASAGGSAGGPVEGLEITLLTESDGADGVDQSFLVETFNVYPGDIQAVVLESEIFGESAGEQVLFTCTPPSLDDSNNFTDYQCTALTVDGSVTVELYSKFGDGIAFQLAAPDSTMDALGDRVEFAYQVSYRVPTDLDGNPFMCGTETCPARPNSEGSVSVRLASDVPVLSDLNVVVGSGDPTSFGDISSLDVTREVIFSGVAISGAVEYELNVFCPGSEPGEDFLPEENMTFFAPAKDENGRATQPEFVINVPWIGGRSCDFTVSAVLENDAGEFVGFSSISFDDVVTSGGSSADGGGFIDNELKLAVGDNLCLLQGADGGFMPSTENCDDTNTIFALNSIDTNGDQPAANIVFGSGVQEAHADGGRKELTYGQLTNGSIVSIDLDTTGDEPGPPSCGVISTDTFSNACFDGETVVEMFEVSSDATVMMITDSFQSLEGIDVSFNGPVDSNGDIPLDQSGFYVLVDRVTGEEYVEINIDQFTSTVGSEVWARFTLVSGANEYDGQGDNTFALTSPAFMFVMHSLGQPLDFDIRYVRDTEMKLAWFLPPPRASIDGDHDINGDGTTDMTASYDSGAWTFTFLTDSVTHLERFTSTGPQELTETSSGQIAVVVQESEGFTEFSTSFTDTQFNVLIQMEEGGNGFIEFYEVFGGPTGGSDGGDGCFECPQALIDFGIGTDEVISLYRDDSGFNLDGVGEEFLSFQVDATSIVASLPLSTEGVDLMYFDPSTNENVIDSTLTLGRGDNVPSFIHYLNGLVDNDDWMIEVFDTGFDVVIRVFANDSAGGGSTGGGDGSTGGGDGSTGGGGGSTGGGGSQIVDSDFDGVPDEEDALPNNPLEFADTDEDTVGDLSDNCPLLANPLQTDVDENGIGDDCELGAFDLTGHYLTEVTITSMSGGSCDSDEQVGDSFTMTDYWQQRGTTVTQQSSDTYEGSVGLGTVDVQGLIAMTIEDEFEDVMETLVIDAVYEDRTGIISGTVTETETDPSSSVVLCTVVLDLVSSPGSSSVDASAILASGLYQGDGYFYYDGFDEFYEFEYEEFIFDGSTTTQMDFYFDVFAGDWVMESAEDLLMLGTGGWTVVPELRTVVSVSGNQVSTEVVSAGETFVAESHELMGWDISDLAQYDLVPAYWDERLLDDAAVFPTGSNLIAINSLVTQEGYEVDCNRGDEMPLDCENIVAIGYDEVADQPIPATSLDDLLTPAGSSEPVQVILEADDNRMLAAVFEGDTAVAGSTGSVTLHLLVPDAGVDFTLASTEWSTQSIHGETLLLVDIPEGIGRLFGMDNEEMNILFTVIPDTSDSNDYVRIGDRIALSNEFTQGGFYNGTAFDSILSSQP